MNLPWKANFFDAPAAIQPFQTATYPADMSEESATAMAESAVALMKQNGMDYVEATVERHKLTARHVKSFGKTLRAVT